MTKTQTSTYPLLKKWTKKAEITQLMGWTVYHRPVVIFQNPTSNLILMKLKSITIAISSAILSPLQFYRQHQQGYITIFLEEKLS